MQQTLTQMNDRTEALDRLATQKEAANNAKAAAEANLAVSWLALPGFPCLIVSLQAQWCRVAKEWGFGSLP